MILLIDNYDSFSHNLARYIKLASPLPLQIIQNDQLSIDEIKKLSPSHLILSPGPGNPNETGVTLKAIDYFKTRCPILGICLGHQAIGQYFGATISPAKNVLHGKTSIIQHNHDPIFQDIAEDFIATRYHSLIIKAGSLPKSLAVIASSDNEIMAIKHKHHPIYGIQFHPEAYLTKIGLKLIKNFFRLNHARSTEPAN